eukprot:SAG25_NODE_7392_length_483_cov_0.929688_1_plen_36_part_01
MVFILDTHKTKHPSSMILALGRLGQASQAGRAHHER